MAKNTKEAKVKTVETDPWLVEFKWRCTDADCGKTYMISYGALAEGAPPTCSECDRDLELVRED